MKERNSNRNEISDYFGQLKLSQGWVPAGILILTLLNLSLVSQDMWDGVIFAYGNEIGDLRGWQRNMDESGWESAGPLMLFSVWLGELLGGTYFLGYKLIVGLALTLTTYEVFQFLGKVLRLPNPWPALGSAFVVSSTVWTASAGSAMIWHVVAVPLVLLSIRIIYSGRSPFLTVVGFLLLIPSFSLNSVLAFAPALAVAHEWSRQKAPSIKGLITLSAWRPYLVVIMGGTYFLLQAAMNPKHGRYAEYNNLESIQSSSSQVVLIAQAALWFVLFTAPVLVIILGFAKLKSLEKPEFFRKIRFPNKVHAIASSLLLILVSALPYIAVGKAPIGYEVWDWQGRHGFLFSVALASLLAATLAWFSESSSTTFSNGARLAAGLVVLFSALLQTLGFQFKIDRNQFDDELVSKMSVVMPTVKEGYVIFESFGGPTPSHPDGYQYDMQFLIFKATGEPKWLTTKFQSNPLQQLPSKSYDPVDKLRDIYSGTSLSCTTELRILGKGWGVPFGPAIRFILGKDAPTLELEIESAKCVY
jgi:hypothetical protein